MLQAAMHLLELSIRHTKRKASKCVTCLILAVPTLRPSYPKVYTRPITPFQSSPPSIIHEPNPLTPSQLIQPHSYSTPTSPSPKGGPSNATPHPNAQPGPHLSLQTPSANYLALPCSVQHDMYGQPPVHPSQSYEQTCVFSSLCFPLRAPGTVA